MKPVARASAKSDSRNEGYGPVFFAAGLLHPLALPIILGILIKIERVTMRLAPGIEH